jgi:hypothetical protein
MIAGACGAEFAVAIQNEQMQKQRRKCHLPAPELAGKSEKLPAGFGAGVIFESDPCSDAESRI